MSAGLDRAAAERHFRWRPAVAPGGFAFRATPDGQSELAAAQRRGDIVVEMDDADRRVTVRWSDAGCGEPVVGAAVARPGYGGSSWGRTQPCTSIRGRFFRKQSETGRTWPLGDAVEKPPEPPPEVARALDAFFAHSSGAYGVLIATPERILCERYSEFGAADRNPHPWYKVRGS